MESELSVQLEQRLRTPTRRRTSIDDAQTPRRAAVLQEALQTPRRSTRKSVKPAQEYEEIVAKRALRSGVKENKSAPNEVENEEEDDRETREPQPKWTPAKVGRVSQKRGRRSKRTVGKKEKSAVSENYADKENPEDNVADADEEPNGSAAAEAQAPKDIKKDLTETVEKLIEVETVVEQVEVAEVVTIVEKNNLKVAGTEENSVQENQLEHVVINVVNSVETIVIPEEQEEESAIVAANASKTVDKNIESHLNLKGIDISDLGLNPLLEDESAVDIKVDAGNKDENEKMSPLIIFDDDEEEIDNVFKPAEVQSGSLAEVELISSSTENAANETFDTSDCIIVSPVEEMKSISPRVIAVEDDDCDMQPLQLSEDDEDYDDAEEKENEYEPKFAKIPKIVLTTPKSGTPKQRPKAYRFPTPYRRREPFKFEKAEEYDIEDTQERNSKGLAVTNVRSTSKALSKTLPLTTLEPKEIVLRSIRKRSLSVCIDGAVEKRKQARVAVHRVTFHSPANQTTVIDDLDILIAKSVKKTLPMMSASRIPATKDINVTQRRKRSMSFDESLMSSSSKLPKPAVMRYTPRKMMAATPEKAAPVQLRTKLPNFRAIHEKHFKQMENLVEHVTRKAERAKALTTSATKARSAQKATPNKIQALTQENAEKPKAVKKIQLGNAKKPVETTTVVPNAGKSATAVPAFTGITKQFQLATKPLELKTTSSALLEDDVKVVPPTPRLAIIKPMLAAAASNVTVVSKKKPTQPTPVKRVLRAATQLNSTVAAATTKPAFNLFASTHNVAIKQQPSGVCAGGAPPLTRDASSREDTMTTRRQRHMEMFKGRTATTARKNGEFIRGVRSNRRFDLQMQHRRNMEMDHN